MTDIGDERAPNRSVIVAGALIALAPAIMAVTTWTPDNYFSTALYFWRFYAPPVLAIELLTVAIALRSGFRPLLSIRSLPHWVTASIGVLIAIDVGTAIFAATDASAAGLRCSITLLHLVFGFAVAYLAAGATPDQYRRIWLLLAAGSLIYVLLLALFVMSIKDPVGYAWEHFGLGVVQFRHIGFYAVIGAAIGLAVAVIDRHPAWRIAAIGLALLCATEFFWTGSRSPILALLIVPPATALLVPALRTLRFAGAWLVTIAGAAALSLIHHPPSPHYGIFRVVETGSRATAAEMSSGRFEIWRSSIETALQRPFFGYGEAQFIHVVPASADIYHHPHNVLIQIAVQWGLVGLIVFLPLAMFVWWRIFQAARRPGSRIVPGFLAINMLGFYALLDGIFFFVYPMMILTTIVALCLAAAAREKPEPA